MHINTAFPGQCPSCLEKLKQAHQDLSTWFTAFVHPRHPDCHIAWSYRNKDEQNDLFNRGKTLAPYPKSKHNSTNAAGLPESQALDLFQLVRDQALFSLKYNQEIYEETKQAGFSIQWAGNWRTFREYDHFELNPEVPALKLVTNKEGPDAV